MKVTYQEFIDIIDAVGKATNEHKALIKRVFKEATGKEYELPVKWYRKNKNADIKNALALAGFKRGFSVRAEKTMGALPEYQSKNDQDIHNRFDLSWEAEEDTDTRDFILAVEIEMSVEMSHITKDFRKLVENQSDCLKVIICQAKRKCDESELLKEMQKIISEQKSKPTKPKGTFVLTIWSWESKDNKGNKGKFIHKII